MVEVFQFPVHRCSVIDCSSPGIFKVEYFEMGMQGFVAGGVRVEKHFCRLHAPQDQQSVIESAPNAPLPVVYIAGTLNYCCPDCGRSLILPEK